MAKIVNGFPQSITTKLLIGSNLRHRKIGLAKHYTFGVDADKNLCNRFDIKIVGQLDQTDLLGENIRQLTKAVVEQVLIHLRVCGEIFARNFMRLELPTDNGPDIR